MDNQLKNNSNTITQKDLTNELVIKYTNLSKRIIENAAKNILDLITQNLSKGNKIELRGFGTFKPCFRSARIVRNPKNGERSNLSARYVVHFKPGKALSVKINNSEK